MHIKRNGCSFLLFLLLGTGISSAQQRVKAFEGYERYQQVRRSTPRIMEGLRRGALQVTWSGDGSSFEFERDGKLFRYDIARRREAPLIIPATRPASRPVAGAPFRARDGGAGRGRQVAVGYASVMCLLRYPEVFHAACASSPPTDWRNYDTIYTERYMWLPRENPSGYDAASAMTYVRRLQGPLMLYYGTADNNVHPSNTLQLVAALQRAGKSFDLQVGPDRGHSGINVERMVEFFADSFGMENVQSAR